MTAPSLLPGLTSDEPFANQVHVPPVPACFPDLHLDVVELALCDGEEDAGLESFFRCLPGDPVMTRARQAVFADLALPPLRAAAEAFSIGMRETTRALENADKVHVPDMRRHWRLEAAGHQCACLKHLHAALSDAACPLKSDGLLAVRAWLGERLAQPDFQHFDAQQSLLAARIENIRFILRPDTGMLSMQISEAGRKQPVAFHAARFAEKPNLRHAAGLDGSEDNPATKDRYPDARPLTDKLRDAFAAFADTTPHGEVPLFRDLEAGPLERRVLDSLRTGCPDIFDDLAAWESSCPLFPDPAFQRLYRELRFFLAWLSLQDGLSRRGYPFTHADIRNDSALSLHGMYDLALALRQPLHELVANDCVLDAEERCMVLTGPNQGGKTTFARALGQAVWLAALGCPLPASAAILPPIHNVLSLFTVRETADSATGRLAGELARVRETLSRATSESLVLLNELYATTATQDALTLGRKTLSQLTATGCHVLYVTHLTELAGPETGTVSLVAEGDAEHPEARTFRIHRRPADGLVCAVALAARHGLDGKSVRKRLHAGTFGLA